MTRAESSTGVLQNALAAFKLRSEVAESLTGVLQNAFLIPQASQRIGRIVDRGAPTIKRRIVWVNIYLECLRRMTAAPALCNLRAKLRRRRLKDRPGSLLGASWEALGGLLGASLELLGAFRRHLGVPWDLLGVSWGPS